MPVQRVPTCCSVMVLRAFPSAAPFQQVFQLLIRCSRQPRQCMTSHGAAVSQGAGAGAAAGRPQRFLDYSTADPLLIHSSLSPLVFLAVICLFSTTSHLIHHQRQLASQLALTHGARPTRMFHTRRSTALLLIRRNVNEATEE